MSKVMEINRIDFRWARCIGGYELLPWKPADPKAENIEIDEDDGDGDVVINPKSCFSDVYEPLKYHPELFKEFAYWDNSDNGLLEFCNRFGRLFGKEDKCSAGEILYHDDNSFREEGKEPHFVNRIRIEQRFMKGAMLWNGIGGLSALAGCMKERFMWPGLLVFTKEDELVFQPENLLDAMKCQFLLRGREALPYRRQA